MFMLLACSLSREGADGLDHSKFVLCARITWRWNELSFHRVLIATFDPPERREQSTSRALFVSR